MRRCVSLSKRAFVIFDRWDHSHVEVVGKSARGWDLPGECENRDVANLVGEDFEWRQDQKRRRIARVDLMVEEEFQNEVWVE